MTEIDDVVSTFSFFDDWDQRYQYLVDMGEQLPPMANELKTEDNWVKPCMSTVHVYAEPVPGQTGLIRYGGDCDTAIIKGVLALLIDVMSNRTLDEIKSLDIDGLFKQLQLQENLSPNRHVGIYAIVEKMVERAEALSLKIH